MAAGTVEIITGRERRRRWSIEEKLRIVAETQEPGARVSEVAVRHGVYPSLLFSWRRQVREGVLTAPVPATFVPITLISAEREQRAAEEVTAVSTGAASAATMPGEAASVEITLPNGCRLRVDQRVDARALRRIVGALRG